MGKRAKSHQKVKDTTTPKRRRRHEDADPEDMDDEIDAFHKQRDVVPLDINGDAGDSDDDNEEPVFDFQDGDEDDDGDDDNEDGDDDTQLTGFAAKIARQQKYMRAKFGGVEDEMHNEEEDEEDKKAWGGRKDAYYNADEGQSSDEADEEAEVLRLQDEKAKSLSMEDFGLEDDGEPTLEEIMVKRKHTSKSSTGKLTEEDMGSTFEEVKKDVNALSKEEQMDVLYSSAPELVGLLSELNDAIEELESKVNPLLIMVKERQPVVAAGIRFLEVKQLLLQSYCQAITFYLLLKSEGQPVRDHPVIARLVEIKSSLDKMKQLDKNLTSDLEEILNRNQGDGTVEKMIEENPEIVSGSFTEDQEPTPVTASQLCDSAELVGLDHSKDIKRRGGKHNHKRENDEVGVQSMEMFKVRALLEEKLKGKGLISSISSKPHKAQRHLKPVNGQLETYDDFDDDALNVDGATQGLSNGKAISSHSNKLSQIVAAKPNLAKVISGDDDLPRRDDIGERRRKHELRVLAGAGINSEDDIGNELVAPEVDADSDMEDTGESEDELYEEVKKQRAAKLAAKAEIYSRTSAAESLPETADGKRHISYQMEKNRGLTRSRKKEIKNPRKKYKLKHKKAEIRRKGQVREIRKPAGPYGGESTGINASISRSVRFKG